MQTNLNSTDPTVDPQNPPQYGYGDTGTTTTESSDGGQNRTLLQIAWERKLLLLLGAVVGTVLAYFWYKQVTPTFQSSARVLVLRKGPDALPLPGLDSRLSYLEDYVATQQLIIKSPVLLKEVVKRPEIQALSWYKDERQAIQRLMTVLNVVRGETKDQSPNMLRFTYASPDAAESGMVLFQLIQCYKEYLDETYKDTNRTTEDLLKGAITDLEARIKNQEKNYGEFLKNAPLELLSATTTKQGGLINLASIGPWQAEVETLTRRQHKITAHLKWLEDAQKSGLPRLVLIQRAESFQRTSEAGPVLQAAKANFDDQLQQLQFEESTLLQQLGKDHSTVKRIHRRIEFLKQLEEQRRTETTALVANKNDPLDLHGRMLQLEYKENDFALKGYELKVKEEVERARNMLTFAREEENLTSEKARIKDTQQLLQRKLQDLGLVKDSGGYRLEVIGPPPRLGSRIAPNRDSYLGGGLAIGLLAGFGLVYLALASKICGLSAGILEKSISMGGKAVGFWLPRTPT